MKIKFFSNYETSAGLLKRFLANYYVNDDQITFTVAEDYDYAVVFNRTDDIILDNAKVITIIQEPSWSPAHINTSFLENSDFLVIHDRQCFENRLGIKLGGKIYESPSYMFYDDRIDKCFFQHGFNNKKGKKLSMIVSSMNAPFGIYNKRISLLIRILESDLEIDIYGRGLKIDDERYKGPLDYKFLGLLPYEYSIAIENSEEKNYLTEKFVDCVLCNTIPIYHGAPNADTIYDPHYFKVIDPESTSIIDDLKRIITNPSSLSSTNKTIYFTKYNLYNKLKEIIFEQY